MGIFKKIVLDLVIREVRGGAQDMFGKNWKGRIGGIGMMLMGAAGVLTGAACVVNSVTGDNTAGLGGCWEQMAAGVALFSAGLGLFGIREALGKRE